MATDYLLPLLNPTIQSTVTYLGASSSISGTISLTAAGNLVSPTLSGTTAVNLLTATFALAPTNTLSMSASNIGIYLTQGTRYGNVIVYGRATNTTLNGATSTVTATITFDDPNYATTALYLSAIGNTARFLTTSKLDNPLVIIQGGAARYTDVYGSLTSRNVVYRTVGRQVRLRQGYEA